MGDEKYILKQWSFWLDELYSYTILKRKTISLWYFTDDKRLLKNPIEGWREIRVGETWNDKKFPVWFYHLLTFPSDLHDQPIYLSLNFGGEALLYINGKPFSGLNNYHQDVLLTKCPRREEKFEILVEVVPKGLFGQHQYEPRFSKAEIFQRDEELYNAYLDFYVVWEVANTVEEPELKNSLLNLLENTLGKIELPTSFEIFSSRTKETKILLSELKNLWKMPELGEIKEPLSNETRDSILEIAKNLRGELRRLRDKYPSFGKIYAFGHSHLDYAWLWPREETIRKAQRTFSTMLKLMDEFEDFKFLQSSAQIYKDIKENNSDLYEKIKEKVKEGKWIFEGGMWVESDCQLTSGESLVRQFLYAQKFFEKEFGRKCKIAWLPDTFGFNANLPQILKKAGIEYFATTKLTWNETNRFPYDLFYWKGIDGTKIKAHIFCKKSGYNAMINPKELLDNWKEYDQRYIYPATIYSFGYGDGGGGPTREMLEKWNKMKDFPGLPEIIIESPLKFFEKVPENLPTYFGELYLELHRGTYTTQGRIKRLNRRAENHLFILESLSSISYLKGKGYNKEISRLWEKLLRNQFHDILPGSSIREVYEDTEKELNDILNEEPQINWLSGDKRVIFIYNPTSFPQQLKIEVNLSDEALYTSSGKILPYQEGDKLLIYDPSFIIPPLSYVTLPIKEKKEFNYETDIKIKENCIENKLFILKIYEDGTIQIYDKERKREVFKERGNQLWVFYDRPRNWEAWDISLDYEKFGKEIKEVESIKFLEKGPLRVKIEVVKRFRESLIKQIYVIYSNSPRIDVENEIDWKERRILLKAIFPLNVNSPLTFYEIPYGVYFKLTHENTSWEKAKFEFPVHRFINLSQGDFGVSILNNGKYGHNVRENTIGLTLLRSPVLPDFYADLGKHEFTYSILPHSEDWKLITIKEAEELNRPLFVKEINNGEITEESIIKWDSPNILIGALKKGEEGENVILRFAEYFGWEKEIEFVFNFPIKEVYECNLLEENLEKIKLEGNKIRVKIKPYELKTLKLIL
ncbi:MAG: alpha-mannosidase [Dictyoglomaceae bacterium]